MRARAAWRLAGAAAVAVAVAALVPPAYRQQARRAALEAETARWIARTREVYLLLEPGIGELRVRAHQVRLVAGVWFSVDCYLPGRGFVGSCWWDARTGRLDMMSYRPMRRQASAGDRLDARSASAAALRWATLLGAMRPKEHWAESARPEAVSDHWVLRYRWGGRTAFVLVDSRTGQPRMIRMSRAR